MTHNNKGDVLIRWIRVARALEAGGFYNAAKLFWATVFSTEIRASNSQSLPIAPDELDREMALAINEIATFGGKPEQIAALERGRAGARENRTIPASDIPQVFVCRTCGEVMLDRPPHHCPTCGAHILTFREFTPVYFLEPLEPSDALDALAQGPAEVEEAITGLAEENMRRPPQPGEWAVRDVLSHILIAEGLLSARIDKMLVEENPSLQGVAAWNVDGEDSLSARDVFERYWSSRRATVERLKNIHAQDWWRTAQHEEFVRFTLLQQASYFAKHERYHLPQIAAIRQAIDA